MGMYTYINDQDIKRWSKVEDKDLNNLLQEVREIDDRFMIYEHKVITKQWFKKEKNTMLYSIRIREGYQARIVNFTQDHEWSINELVSKSYIMTYLYGLLTGFKLLTPPKP